VRLTLVNPSKVCLRLLDVTDTAQLFEIVTSCAHSGSPGRQGVRS
jgi:hypothetical protein